ncbi:MAG TPA: D-alanine--D-alanine ligase [Phycisphaerae bacterium]|nr:D-alanine--D-alanine ligase [Phycisphaerae bacterium]
MPENLKIGLTYDLRADYLAEGYGELETAEFDRPDTIEAIENALRQLGHQTDRIGHFKNLVKRVANGDRWDMVFNIAEGMHGIGREAQVPALLDAYEIPYTFSDPLVSALTLHKALAKRAVRDAGIPTAEFFVVECEADIERVNLPYPVFAKPNNEGTAKGIDATSKINSPDELAQVCRRLLAEYQQPVLVETFLPGREFTVGIVGTGPAARIVGTTEIILMDRADPEVYSYKNKEYCEELVKYARPEGTIVRRAEEISLAAWRVLGCRDGGRVDVRADAKGDVKFLEVNPLAGLHPEHSDLPIICTLHGISYQELIRMIVDSALERMPARTLRAPTVKSAATLDRAATTNRAATVRER